MVENKSLPGSDPFAYTSLQGIMPYREIILNGYWLSQVIFYFAYALFGDYGLVALRVVLLLSVLFTYIIFARKWEWIIRLAFLCFYSPEGYQ